MKTWLKRFAVILIFVSVQPALAQESKETKIEKPTVAVAQTKVVPQESRPGSTYRLAFTVSEVQDGKSINSREYTTMVVPDDWGRLRIVTRVPYESTSGATHAVQYMDVGLSLDAMLRSVGNELRLEASCDISSFAIPEQAEGRSLSPVTRDIRSQAQILVSLGKPTLLSTLDDPNSMKRYEIAVTVTKLK